MESTIFKEPAAADDTVDAGLVSQAGASAYATSCATLMYAAKPIIVDALAKAQTTIQHMGEGAIAASYSLSGQAECGTPTPKHAVGLCKALDSMDSLVESCLSGGMLKDAGDVMAARVLQHDLQTVRRMLGVLVDGEGNVLTDYSPYAVLALAGMSDPTDPVTAAAIGTEETE